MTRCRNCHRELTNPESIAKGIGPVCERKEAGSTQFRIQFSLIEKCRYCGQFVKSDGKSITDHRAICPGLEEVKASKSMFDNVKEGKTSFVKHLK